MPSPETRPDPGPFDLPGEGRAAALCLHGLTGTPFEVRPLGKALADAGVRAVGPVLPGHGDSLESLRVTSHEQWVDFSRSQAQALRQRHEPLFAVGLSMGGLLALLLASEGLCDGVVCIGVPLRLRQPGAGLVRLLRHVVRDLPKWSGSDIRDEAARARHPSYPVMPLAAVHELQQLQARVREVLPRVTVPLLVAHGAHDRTADPRDAREILESVGAAECRHLLLERSAHVAPVDHDGELLAREVAEFLGKRLEIRRTTF